MDAPLPSSQPTRSENGNPEFRFRPEARRVFLHPSNPGFLGENWRSWPLPSSSQTTKVREGRVRKRVENNTILISAQGHYDWKHRTTAVHQRTGRARKRNQEHQKKNGQKPSLPRDVPVEIFEHVTCGPGNEGKGGFLRGPMVHREGAPPSPAATPSSV